MKVQLNHLLLTASVAVAAPFEASHHDHNQKRDVITVTQFVNANGDVVIPAASTYSTDKVSTATHSIQSTSSKTTLQPKSSSTSTSNGGGINGDLSNFVDPSEKFEDGTIKCSDFPSGQGVISLDWLGLDGWSSIQDSTGLSKETCEDGVYCSYACQAGMSKTQWSSDQPESGASLGGLECKDGYLYRTNKDTDYLCQWDVDSASAVNNNENGGIALCRTDYPGSENMVVPTWVESGSSKPISVVDEDTYYQWQGKKTSTQYYVNNAGVSVEDGCIWGSEGSGVGNWAPLVLGAGYTDGKTYLSLIPNPNNKETPNFNVKIVATDGSVVNGDCKYENGEFSDSSDGCTVTVISGSAQFVFY